MTLFYKNAPKSVFHFLIIDSLRPGHYPRVNIKDNTITHKLVIFTHTYSNYLTFKLYSMVLLYHLDSLATSMPASQSSLTFW